MTYMYFTLANSTVKSISKLAMQINSIRQAVIPDILDLRQDHKFQFHSLQNCKSKRHFFHYNGFSTTF